MASSLPKMSICPLKSSQLPHTSAESSRSDLGQLSSTQQLITPCKFRLERTNSVDSHRLIILIVFFLFIHNYFIDQCKELCHTHVYSNGHNGVAASLCPAVVKHQLHCPLGPRGTHQFIIQQSASAHRQMQPIALRVKPQEQAPPLSVQTRPLPPQPPLAPSAQSQAGDVLTAAASSTFEHQQQQQPQSAVLVSPTSSGPAQAVRPLLQLGPLGEALPLSPHASAQNYGSITTTAVCTNPLQGSLTSPPPASLQRLSLRSVQALAVESGQVLVSEEELPVAEALVQMPFQNLPPPQTVAVDLKMQSVAQTATPSVSTSLIVSEQM